MAEPPERIHIPMRRELLERIDDFRFTSRAQSRAEAIRRLIETGLLRFDKDGRTDCSGHGEASPSARGSRAKRSPAA